MSASKEIDSKTVELEVKNGLDRIDFPSITFRNIVNKKHQEIFNNELITYVPFLPISKNHVKQCVQLEWKRYYPSSSYGEEEIQKISDMLNYEQAETSFYSTSGCTRIRRLIIDYFSNL